MRMKIQLLQMALMLAFLMLCFLLWDFSMIQSSRLSGVFCQGNCSETASSLPPVFPPRLDTPLEHQEILRQWSHLSEETLTVLKRMLIERNDKLLRYANAKKLARTMLFSVDWRLPAVLKNMRKNLGPEWTIEVLHTPEIAEWIRSLPEIEPTNTKLLMTLHSNFTYNDYSTELLSISFWRDSNADIVLIFQADTAMCANTPFRIVDYFDYDYVGAPWGHWLTMQCGNGGLSLRKPAAMLRALNLCPYDPSYGFEDSWICRCFAHNTYNGQLQVNVPNYTISRYFAVETLWTDTSIGVHKPGAYYGNAGEHFFSRCPEAEDMVVQKAGQPPPSPVPFDTPAPSSFALK